MVQWLDSRYILKDKLKGLLDVLYVVGGKRGDQMRPKLVLYRRNFQSASVPVIRVFNNSWGVGGTYFPR